MQHVMYILNHSKLAQRKRAWRETTIYVQTESDYVYMYMYTQNLWEIIIFPASQIIMSLYWIAGFGRKSAGIRYGTDCTFILI